MSKGQRLSSTGQRAALAERIDDLLRVRRSRAQVHKMVTKWAAEHLESVCRGRADGVPWPLPDRELTLTEKYAICEAYRDAFYSASAPLGPWGGEPLEAVRRERRAAVAFCTLVARIAGALRTLPRSDLRTLEIICDEVAADLETFELTKSRATELLVAVRAAIQKHGRDTKPDVIICEVQKRRKDVRDCLARLAANGEYDGFAKPCPPRYRA